MHFASGGTAVLPQAADVSAFAVYHGGWLLGSAVMPGVQWYDNTGTLEQSGVGAYQLAASADGMRVAYRMGKEIRIGIASGMGEGEQRIPVGKSVGGWPVGFLSGGTLVYMAGDHVRADQAMTTPFPSSMALADAVSVNDVVAGEDSQQRGMAWSARTGKTLWSDSKWVVSAFSADGRYAAASAQPSAGGSEVAILDTQTGDVIAQHSLRDDEATVGGGGMAFDRDDSLLMVAVNSKEDRAVLRLTTAGTLTRATPVLAFDIRHDPVGIVFATGP